MKFFNYLAKSYHRNLIEQLLYKYKYLIKGNILDIGSKNRRYDHLFRGKITAIDINPKPELNIIEGNLINLKFPSDSFDSILCLEVLQYLDPDNLKKGLDEIYRVLKHKGTTIISIPFYYHEHEDNMRLTYGYILNYLKNLNKGNYVIIKIGNRYTALFDAIRYSRKIWETTKFRNLGTKLILFALYLSIKNLSLENKKDSFYSGYFIIWSKI